MLNITNFKLIIFIKKKMKQFKLTIDTDTINMENEIHINNFSQKIKNLALHCMNFVYGIEDKEDCLNNRYTREFHDDNDSTIGSYNIPPFIKTNNGLNCTKFDKRFPYLLHS